MDGITLNGWTSTLGPRGLGESTQSLSVDRGGDYNVSLSTPLSSFAIRNSKNELVAYGTNALSSLAGRARLAPGTYSVLISEQVEGARDRPFSLSLSPHLSAAVTGDGGTLQGTMDAPVGAGQQEQEHTLFFTTGGPFNINLNLPRAAYALRTANGDVVASGINGATASPDFQGEGTNVDAGLHGLTVIGFDPPADTRWTVNITPGISPAPNSSAAEEASAYRQKWDAAQATRDLVAKAQRYRSPGLLV